MPKGALGTIEGEHLVILKTRLLTSDGDHDASAPAGSILLRDQDRFVVQCGDGPLEILDWGAGTS